MPHCSVMSMGTPYFISKLKFSCDKYSVDKVWTKIYGHFYFQGNYLKLGSNSQTATFWEHAPLILKLRSTTSYHLLRLRLPLPLTPPRNQKLGIRPCVRFNRKNKIISLVLNSTRAGVYFPKLPSFVLALWFNPVWYFCTLRGEKLNYKSFAKEISKPPFFGSWSPVGIKVSRVYSIHVSSHAHIWYVTWPQ